MKNFSNPQFLDLLRAQDKTALSDLIDAYTDHLYKASLGMGLSEEMARDVTSNTWTTFIEIVPRFEGRSHIRTFLFGIFYNKVAELRRANLKFDKTDPIEESLETNFDDDGHWSVSWADPHRNAENSEVLKIIANCLEHLPILQKTAFYMKHVQEDSTEEICEALDVTNVNLRQLIFRAKNRIRICVENNLNS